MKKLYRFELLKCSQPLIKFKKMHAHNSTYNYLFFQTKFHTVAELNTVRYFF